MAELREEQRGPARFLIIDREAQRNALSFGLLAELRDALARADRDDGVRALCLTGPGDKAFCAGMDFGASAAALPAGPRPPTRGPTPTPPPPPCPPPPCAP